MAKLTWERDAAGTLALKDPSVRGPALHALIIGVSHYRHLKGGSAPNKRGRKWGMKQLTAAASSAASVADWLLNKYNDNSVQFGSLRMLLSPQPRENLGAPLVGKKKGALDRATRANVENAVRAFQKACELDRDNVAFVYMAGHGIQLSTEEAVLLLEDVGDDNHANDLTGAVDAVKCHRAFNHAGGPARQFWFVDACRQEHEIAKRFVFMTGALELSKPPGSADSSPLFLAAASREAAFARVGKKTLFSEALIAALEGDAAVGPDKPGEEWYVSTLSLNERLTTSVKALAKAVGKSQTVEPGGLMTKAVVHRFAKPPSVRLRLNLDPAKARSVTKASLSLNGGTPVPKVPTKWPLQMTLAAGLYLLDVTTKPPYTPKRDILKAMPPDTIGEISVQP